MNEFPTTVTVPGKQVSVPQGHCSSCFADNPTRSYAVQGSASERSANAVTTATLNLTLPLCDACFLDRQALDDYDTYRVEHDPSYNDRAANLSVLLGLLALAAFAAAGVLGLWLKLLPVAGIVLAAVAGLVLAIIAAVFGNRISNPKVREETQALAKSRFNGVQAEVPPPSAAGKLSGLLDSIVLTMENDDYAQLVLAANPGARWGDLVETLLFLQTRKWREEGGAPPWPSVVVNARRAAVWGVFADPGSWESWWEGGVRAVEPGWQEGGKIVWSQGAPSTLAAVRTGSLVRIESPSVEHTFWFHELVRGATTVQVGFEARGGASFGDGGEALRADMAACLGRLKELVESQPSTPSSAPRAAGNPLGIEFKQEAVDLLKRMERMSAERPGAEYAVGDKVRVRMPLAGTAKPEETGLPHEIILDEGLAGTITAVNADEMVRVRWNAGKYRIYRDLDLASMRFVDGGSVRLEGFEGPVHSSYLEKTR